VAPDWLCVDTGPLIVNKNNVSTVEAAINAGQD